MLVLKEYADLDRTAKSVENYLKLGRHAGSVALCTKPPGERWTIAAIVEPSDRVIADGLTQEFHGAEVIKVATPPPGLATPGVHTDLAGLIEQWRTDTGYPTESDEKQIAARPALAAILLKESVAAAIADPAAFDLPEFRRLVSRAYAGAGNQAHMNRFLSSGHNAIRRLAQTIDHLLYGEGEAASRIDDVLEREDWRVPGFSEALATKCLAILHPESWIPLFVYSGPNGKKAIISLPELPVTPLDDIGRTRGELAVESNDILKQVLEPYIPGDSWGQRAFLWWLLERSRGGGEAIVAERSWELGDLAAELLIPEEWLRTIIELLEDKRQVILYGPPGTGKTYIARQLARFLAPDVAHRMTVQFHPSYSYEDFVEGYRPLGGGEEGAVWYDVLPGPLKRLAEEAEITTDACVLFIDEINRGNIAKIFGELYYLLEYRDDEVQLQYGSAPFRMPKNLYIIATMNTADRSIALLDAALRRRFHFVELSPDRPPIAGLLARWLDASGLDDMTYVAELVEFANANLPDRHLQIGPSHFMRPGLNREWLERIWRYSVLPYIEEQFFDEPGRIEEFDLAQLEARIPWSSPTTLPGIEAISAPERLPGEGGDDDGLAKADSPD